MTRIICVTPASRPWNFARIWSVLEPLGVEWHPIVHFPDIIHHIPGDIRIRPMLVKCNGWGTWGPPFWKLNQYLDAGVIDPYAYYHFLCDDNLPGRGMYSDLIPFMLRGIDVMMVTALRGSHRPETAENGLPPAGTDPLTAHASRCSTCLCDMGQFIVKGSLLAKHRFCNDYHAADGVWAMSLLAHHGSTAAFLPGTFLLFNVLEKGRFA